MTSQPAIALPPAPAVHYLTLRLKSSAHAKPLCRFFTDLVVDESLIVGFGVRLVAGLGGNIAGLKGFPSLQRPGGAIPVTQGDVWVCARGAAPAEALDRILAVAHALPGGMEFVEDQPAFTRHDALIDSGAGAATLDDGPLAGSSFCVVQRWVFDASGDAASPRGSISLPVDMQRRSTPFGTAQEQGLYFAAFGPDLDVFETVMRRMVGEPDGLVDPLFQAARPVTGGYYWCPAVKDGHLDLEPMFASGGLAALPDIEFTPTAGT